MARRIERFLLGFRWGRKIVCWWGWKMAPWRYTTQIRDQLKIQDLKRENARLKRGFRAVKR